MRKPSSSELADLSTGLSYVATGFALVGAVNIALWFLALSASILITKHFV